jgi:DNA-binding SARP family transcriptional activator
MIVLYKRLSEKTLRKEAKDVIKKLQSWFDENPKRRICRTELWYGKYVTLNRNTFKQQIEKIIKESLN